MRQVRNSQAIVFLASLLVSTSSLAVTQADVDKAMSHDGLQRIKVKGIELAYARPGATLAGYQRVKLDPVEVAFRRDWNPTRTDSNFKLSTEERENIRRGVAKLVEEEFVRELQTKSSYQVVNEAAADVLRVKVNIVNLYANAPDTLTAGRSRTYVVSAGEMSLYAELFDSESGELIARLVDRREARNSGNLSLSSSVFNAGEASAIASAWARILRSGLDKAHGIGKH